MSRRGFTLIEMLVVMGIMAVLLSILIPAAGLARDKANAVKCQSNIKTLDLAMLAFASDNDGHLPGGLCAFIFDRNPLHWDWLFGTYSMIVADNTWGDGSGHQWPGYGYSELTRLAQAPQNGTLWPYVNDYSSYLCPSLSFDSPGCGQGSNGRFDYAMFSVFRGAMVRQIKTTSWYYYSVNTTTGSVWTTIQTYSDTLPDHVFLAPFQFSTRPPDIFPTPLICQEDPAFGVLNGGSYPTVGINNCPTPAVNPAVGGLYALAGSHFGFAQMAHVHAGGSYYGAIDGSVQFFVDPGLTDTSGNTYWDNGGTTGANNWISRGPSGHLRQLGSWGAGYPPGSSGVPANYTGEDDYWQNQDVWNSWSRQ